MFDAYKVAVKLSLTNEVSKGLILLSSQFAKLNKDATLLQAKLKSLKTQALFGAGMAGAGFLGLDLFGKILKPAEDYNHQLNIMNMQGMKHQQIAEAVAAAWKTARIVQTSTATGNLKTFIDLKTVFGHAKEAAQYLPEIARIQAVLKASSESSIRGNAESLGLSMARALDIRGAVFNSAMFNQQAEMMAKVLVATQGRVAPSDYQNLFKYARQATMGLSNRFLYQELPTFMMQMKTSGGGGGGSHGGFGVSLAAFNRLFVQGVMSKSVVAGLQGLGLLSNKAGLTTTTSGTILLPGQHVKGIGLAISDPFQYVQQILLPAIFKKYGNNLTNQQLNAIIASTFKGASSTALFGIDQFAFKAANVYRDERLIKMAKDPRTAYKMAMSNDPFTVNTALSAQWENLKTAFGMSVVPIILPALIKLTDGLTLFASWLRKNQEVAKVLALSFATLAGTLAFSGTVLVLNAAFKALSLTLASAGAAGSVARLASLFTLVGNIGKLGALGAIGYTTYQGTKGFLHITGADKKLGEFGSWIYDKTHPSENPNLIIHTHVHLDSRQVAKSVTRVQAKAAATPTATTTTYNPAMSLVPASATGR